VGEGGLESVTSYGIDKVHCGVAAKIADYFKYTIMGWGLIKTVIFSLTKINYLLKCMYIIPICS